MRVLSAALEAEPSAVSSGDWAIRLSDRRVKGDASMRLAKGFGAARSSDRKSGIGADLKAEGAAGLKTGKEDKELEADACLMVMMVWQPTLWDVTGSCAL